MRLEGKTVEKEKALEKEKEDADLNKTIDEYAEMARDAGMMDDDDLLDEISDPEDLPMEGDGKEGQIEAISQLSPVRSTWPPVPEKKKAKQSQPDKEIRKEPAPKEQHEKRRINPIPMGRRRGSRSPDLKGASASKKLAIRGRLSPKAKQLKFSREEIIPSPSTISRAAHISSPTTDEHLPDFKLEKNTFESAIKR
ncbi:hypothetical protein Bca52824_023840 [Brassica carinata]|uniref:Uncharacterized protein n=1 Tax=Brassica carinata TaxID=52824 RepID=A0A8X7VJI2_BRACI|nr:hypothetical protein Bca52824_023840 [Brassica carinata]